MSDARTNPLDKARWTREPKPQQRCVFVANRLPFPLLDGWCRRTFHLIVELSSAWPVDLFVLHAGDESEVRAFRNIVGDRVTVTTVKPLPFRRYRGALKSLVTGQAMHEAADDHPELSRLVSAAIAHPNVIMCGCACTYMGHYITQTLADTEALRIVDTHNIDSVVLDRYARLIANPFTKWFARLTAKRLFSMERSVFSTADLVLVCSDIEVKDVHERAAQSMAISIPNGVDLERFGSVQRASVSTATALFCGRLDYFPNIDGLAFFFDEIAAKLFARLPELRLRIVGAGDSSRIRAMAAEWKQVDVIGFVPEIQAELATATVAIVPLRSGGGTRLKILEAMAARVPIVTTSLGAEGIDIDDGEHALIRNSPSDFISGIELILGDPELAARLGSAARRRAEDRYSWQAAGTTLRQAVQKSLDARTSPRSA